MENNYEIYQAPDVEVVEIKSEGVVCASGGDYPEWPSEGI